MSTISFLPADVIKNSIFSYFTPREFIRTLGVSRAWYNWTIQCWSLQCWDRIGKLFEALNLEKTKLREEIKNRILNSMSILELKQACSYTLLCIYGTKQDKFSPLFVEEFKKFPLKDLDWPATIMKVESTLASTGSLSSILLSELPSLGRLDKSISVNEYVKPIDSFTISIWQRLEDLLNDQIESNPFSNKICCDMKQGFYFNSSVRKTFGFILKLETDDGHQLASDLSVRFPDSRDNKEIAVGVLQEFSWKIERGFCAFFMHISTRNQAQMCMILDELNRKDVVKVELDIVIFRYDNRESKYHSWSSHGRGVIDNKYLTWVSQSPTTWKSHQIYLVYLPIKILASQQLLLT